LNSRPRAYESPALPLSYLGVVSGANITMGGGICQPSRFMTRARAINPAEPIYILLTTAKNLDEGIEPTGMDDIIQRPFKAADLKNRVAMAERIISLASHLAVARINWRIKRSLMS
jgi:hypothetical protein